ncbi:MAG: hypothetical protein ACJ8GJ_12415 [Vitreoscilla sp.]
MSSFDDLPVLAEAQWLYDGSVPVRIRVHSSPMYYGTGDYEDPTDIAEERPGEFYILSWESAGSPGSFPNAMPNLASIDEVLETVERKFPGARWLTPLERRPA